MNKIKELWGRGKAYLKSLWSKYKYYIIVAVAFTLFGAFIAGPLLASFGS